MLVGNCSNVVGGIRGGKMERNLNDHVTKNRGCGDCI